MMIFSERGGRPEDASWMGIALEEAQLAWDEGEVPVGAVAVVDGQLVARDHNRSVQRSDPTAHAEILVLRESGRRLANYRLTGLQLYVTLEPCAMCAGALIWARVGRLVFGALDEKAGAVFSRASVLESGLFNHTVEITRGPLAEESGQLLRQFFAERRR